LEGVRIDDLARSMHTNRSASRCRVGYVRTVWQHKTVTGARAGIRDNHLMPSVVLALHRNRLTSVWQMFVDRHSHILRSRSKEPKDNSTLSPQLRTETWSRFS